MLYNAQGRYADAEPLYKRSLAINEKALGPDHPDVATSLNNLAVLYEAQGRYTDAEPLYKRVTGNTEKALGPDHPDVAVALNNLAVLYRDQGRYADAEPLYKRSLAISEKALGPEHPDVATSLNNLAVLYRNARSLRRCRAVTTSAHWRYREKVLGPDHPDVAAITEQSGCSLRRQGRYAEAEPLYKRSLAIWEKALGPDHPDVALSLNNLAESLPCPRSLLPMLYRLCKGPSRKTLPDKSIAFAVLYGSENQKLIAPKEALNASYAVLQHSISSAAGEAISKLAARFAAGTNELAQFVRKDQDLTAEADRLDKSIIAAVSKPPAERNHRRKTRYESASTK